MLVLSILNHNVAAWAAIKHIHTRPTDQHVVPIAAEQRVHAGATDQGVIVTAAVGSDTDEPGGERGSVHDIIASQCIDGDAVVRGFAAADVHGCRQAADRDGATGLRDRDRIVGARAADNDVVG